MARLLLLAVSKEAVIMYPILYIIGAIVVGILLRFIGLF